MKRFFSTALAVTLILGLTYSLAYSASTSNGTQDVKANIATAIEITVPGSLDMGNLDIGDYESADQGILVKSNSSYGVLIKADRTNMTEYDTSGGTYVASSPETLGSALQWKESSSGTYADISTTDATVASGLSKTGSSGTTTNAKFKQTVGYDDEPLETGYEYHIIITYTATAGI